MADTIQMRRDTAANWKQVNPVLHDGELGFERDTKRYKMGDGVTPWNQLAYQDPLVQLTQDEYDSLSEEEKNDGRWYFIEEDE